MPIGDEPGTRQARRWAFIFVGGLQPKKIQLEDNPRACPGCGLVSARLRRVDSYLSLFFIPLFPVKKGQPFLECDRCGGVFDPTRKTAAVRPRPGRPTTCPSCGRKVEPEFSFCPSCGQRL